MNDNELLILAAKAAGYETTASDEDPTYSNHGDLLVSVSGADGEWDWWNPLTDDGDALRLAVKLGVFDGGPEFALYRMIECMSGIGIEAATRRAIVRAAAEIGKAMP